MINDNVNEISGFPTDPVQQQNNIKHKNRKKIILISVFGVFLLLVAAGLVSKYVFFDDSPVDVADSLMVNPDELLDPRFAEADDTVFDYGSFPKEEITDTTTYDIPTASENISIEFADVINNSPTYSGFDSVYEVLNWDDFDKDGDIKEDTMRSIIDSAKPEAR